MRLSRCEVRDHINYSKNDRWPLYRLYDALQRLKSPMRYVFGASRFSSFSTISARSSHSHTGTICPTRVWVGNLE